MIITSFAGIFLHTTYFFCIVDKSDANVEGRPIPNFSNSLTNVASVYLLFAFVSFGCAFIVNHFTFPSRFIAFSQSIESSSSSSSSILAILPAFFQPSNVVRFHCADHIQSSKFILILQVSPFAADITDCIVRCHIILYNLLFISSISTFTTSICVGRMASCASCAFDPFNSDFDSDFDFDFDFDFDSSTNSSP